MPQIVTIERHILDQQKRFPQATGALTGLLYDLALSGKLISRETNRAGLVVQASDGSVDERYSGQYEDGQRLAPQKTQ